MKKLYFQLFSVLFLLSAAIPVQSQESKIMQVHSGGNVVYEVFTSQVDSVVFRNGEAIIDREYADEIVYGYIVNEAIRTDCLLLYTIDDFSNAEGISTIMNHKNETFSVEYPCWVYYINEWMDVNGPSFRRYLFVDKIDGNILEVKTRKDFGPIHPGLEDWRLIYSALSEK